MQALQPGPGDDTPATTTTTGPAAVLACMHASLYQSKKNARDVTHPALIPHCCISSNYCSCFLKKKKKKLLLMFHHHHPRHL
jgi:hypothetical protein